jgi:predicted AAA+ superfamily ATPase
MSHETLARSHRSAPDVLNGTFQQSEFAADLTAVRSGKATPEYGDAKSFYDRTFITEGMGSCSPRWPSG